MAWNHPEWELVLFTDESSFSGCWDQKRQVWWPVRCRYKAPYIQMIAASGRSSVQVRSAISSSGLGPLHRMEGSFTASKYVEILREVLLPHVLDGPFPDGFFWLQLYRSPVYCAQKVQDFLEESAIRQLPWPPGGADMNVIENVWGLLKRTLVKRNLQDSSKETLWATLSEEWEKLRLDDQLPAVLFQSLPRRMRDVISSQGGSIKY
ncbi:hypothetical protein HPB47_019761 [Ixodes persulcatus]|uniref:Uncharacterized protein n=1 Tax=Ixodes persulcatus TaxID=34615 RepID=A0AC60QJ67_IXOPE|nr:hypothetical protein HPB47_019761 [Ixodes persulcatus]